MNKITIFTVPRYFKPPFELIQYNAIRSWLRLKPTPEIILCGNDEGVARAAKDLRVKHIPNIKLSRQGTPLVNSVFTEVQKVAKHPILAYVNSDIILMDDFLKTITVVADIHHHQFVIVGQRWDLAVNNPVNFSDRCWKRKLRRKATTSGKLHSPCGIDYYVFRKGLGVNMPPFIAGRPSWDNWFLAQALRDGVGVIDATKKILVIHQNHDYSHTNGIQNARQGAEAVLNRKLAGGHLNFINNASWEFVKGKLTKKPKKYFLVTWTDTATGQRGNLADILAFAKCDAIRQIKALDREITRIDPLDAKAFERGVFQIELRRVDTSEKKFELYIAFTTEEAEELWRLRGRFLKNLEGYRCRLYSIKRLPVRKHLVVR